ncbi:TVP38/TMEM64 family protein [Halodesulfovibrio spirochaetisodalis]|uniref:TVP38/TMEM64 family membrane protein n=1 Tax=Halodesulfovibrio spirochaetisodalis TaxID=1560234 RepID=A0A1B7XQA1_9BACT|nr:VTT domain-containing protein [Halodesulfovibrio spirochaetisodalis]OBQ57698.1 SNARE associated Golgi protein [Halodesulfovibrio spirochaetisodalis]
MPSNQKKLFINLALIGLLVAIVLTLRKLGIAEVLEPEWVDTHIRNTGIQGVLLFIGLAAMLTGMGIPRQLSAFCAGYAFGAVHGFLAAITAVTLGCICCFWIARFLGRETINRRFPHHLNGINSFLQNAPFQTAIIVRLLPVGSNLATNVVAGVSSIRPLPFVAGSSLGYMPQTLIFSLLGSGVTVEPVLRTSVSAVLFILSSALGVRLYKKYRTLSAQFEQDA